MHVERVHPVASAAAIPSHNTTGYFSGGAINCAYFRSALSSAHHFIHLLSNCASKGSEFGVLKRHLLLHSATLCLQRGCTLFGVLVLPCEVVHLCTPDRLKIAECPRLSCGECT